MGVVIKVENFKAEFFFAIKTENWRGGILRPNATLDIKAEKPGEGVLRPNGHNGNKTENCGGGY